MKPSLKDFFEGLNQTYIESAKKQNISNKDIKAGEVKVTKLFPKPLKLVVNNS